MTPPTTIKQALYVQGQQPWDDADITHSCSGRHSCTDTLGAAAQRPYEYGSVQLGDNCIAGCKVATATVWTEA